MAAILQGALKNASCCTLGWLTWSRHAPLTIQEEAHRLGVWMDNLLFVLEHNAQGKSYQVRARETSGR